MLRRPKKLVKLTKLLHQDYPPFEVLQGNSVGTWHFFFIRTCILFKVTDTTQNQLLDNELPVQVKNGTFLTNSAIDERIINVRE